MLIKTSKNQFSHSNDQRNKKTLASITCYNKLTPECLEYKSIYIKELSQIKTPYSRKLCARLESSDNFCSLVNGDGYNDVTEVYPNDDDNQHDVGLEDGDEVDSEVHNDDGGDYDDFWIPGLLKEECISIDSMVDIR
ncbi:hypothetical protein JHK85_010130 [Glycine max]|nr:hypothetical protein JHK85_010130 [Glycine max]